ncbi:MAG TPA: TonB-dependent receptor [Thermoanaerobaculia bacterium]|nr:TonB-dependent receptor [Thermoanaerobaculia bacterium]
MSWKSLCRIFFALLLALGAAGAVRAQSKTTSGLNGRVIGEDGGPLPGATVEISSPALIGGARTGATDADGRFRFPEITPGPYVVVVTLDGFQTVRREGVVLSLGRTTELPITLAVKALEETIVVTGEAPTIDVQSSGTSTNLPNTYLANIPASRFQVDVINLAPGINNDSAFGGGGESANAYQLDGVDVSDPEAGTSWAFVNYNIVEEAELVGLGAPAEYGGFTGVVFNSITKSGGNKVKGSLEAYYTNDALTGDNSNIQGLNATTEKSYDANLQWGGPIRQDKLWYFLSGQQVADDSSSGGPIRTERDPRVFGKLSWQASESLSIDSWSEWDRFDITGRGGDAQTPLEATVTEDAPEIVWNFSGHKVVSPDTIVTVAYGGFDGYYYLDPAKGPNVAGHLDAVTGNFSQNSTFFFKADRTRQQANASVTHHADDFVKGDHDFKFGMEIERSTVRNRYGYPTGAWFYDNYYTADDPGTEAYDPVPYSIGYYGGNYDVHATNKRLSVYAQDTWRISPHVTINPGVRVDLNRGDVKNGNVYSSDPIAPRLGIAWDVTGDGKNLFKAHVGRYYEALFASYYYWVDPDAFHGVEQRRVFPSGFNDFFGNTAGSKFAIDKDLKHPYLDQYLIGFDRELVPGLTLSTSLVYRKNKDFVETVSRDGIFVPVTGFVGVTDPAGNKVSTGQQVTLFNYLNPGTDVLLVTNPPGLERTYKGAIVTLTRRMRDNWQMLFSYVYSKSEGNIDNVSFSSSGGGNGGPGSFLDTPNSLVNAKGSLTNDNTHQVKLQGTYQVPKLNLSFSGNYTYLTGRAYTRRSSCLLANENDTSCIRFSQGTFRYFAEERGSRRLPARNEIDLRAEWQPKLGRGRVGVILDVFNATNQGRATSVEDRDGASFDQPLTFNAPRQYRLGFRYTF